MDLGIVSSGLVPFVSTFTVDSKKDFTLRRVRILRKGVASTFSDHFSLEIVLSNLTRVGKGAEDSSKEGGWKEFEKETEAVAVNVKDIVEDEKLTVEECMGKINAIENKVKFKSFGKSRKPRYHRN